MKACLRLLLAYLSIAPFATGYLYECEPGGDPAVCSIWNLPYIKDHKQLPVVNMPSSAKTVRLRTERYYSDRQCVISTYDDTLHSTILRNPTSVQLIDNRVEKLIIPNDLQTGEFAQNVISEVVTTATKAYMVSYLDLSHNSLVEVDSLGALVSLQTLNLEGNRILTFGASTFASMRNLSRLYLGDNAIVAVDFKVLPKGLTSLWLLRNDFRELSLAGVSLPALTELDLEGNRLATIDLAALFAAFPALSVLPIAYNPFQLDDARRIIGELKRRNVSHYFGIERTEQECDSDEYELEHVCFPDTVLIVRSVSKAIVLILLGLVVLAVFATSVRWIWYQMRY